MPLTFKKILLCSIIYMFVTTNKFNCHDTIAWICFFKLTCLQRQFWVKFFRQQKILWVFWAQWPIQFWRELEARSHNWKENNTLDEHTKPSSTILRFLPQSTVRIINCTLYQTKRFYISFHFHFIRTLFSKY